MSAMGALILGCGLDSEESSDDVAWSINKLKQKADINDIGFYVEDALQLRRINLRLLRPTRRAHRHE